MFLIDRRSKKPLNEQIKDSIRHQIIHGVLLPDEKLPSVREMAQANARNPNTIQKAYHDLEMEGVLYSQVGRGSFVSAEIEQLREKRVKEIEEIINPLLSELRRMGMSEKEIFTVLKGGASND